MPGPFGEQEGRVMDGRRMGVDLAQGSDRSVTIVDVREELPLIMLVFPHRLSPRAIENLQASARRAMERHGPMAVEGPVEVYQLEDGQWRPLKSPSQSDSAT